MGRIEAPASGVHVRMYRHGFGDCFLLTFRGRTGQPVHCMIDCGVHAQWRPQAGASDQRKGSARLSDVVEQVREATGGHVDVVVVTHEHADHVSGFYTARDVFATLTVGEVWMAWTENPESDKARSLDKTRGMMLDQLRAMGVSLAADGEAYENVGQVMGFFDIPLDGDGAGNGLFGVRTRDARDHALELSSNRRFLEPHRAPLTLPGVDDVRVFVLGPPVDERMLKAARPTGEEGEVYEGDDGHDAPPELGSTDRIDFATLHDGLQPFAGNHRLPTDWIRANPTVDAFAFYHTFYGFGEGTPGAWRRIGGELGVLAQDLALRLDSATNNTSLVLAFELSNGRVLLFPGDAQVGNWKSWHEKRWTEENGLDKGEVVTAADLLERTVLYKVAHHGSHNATLKKLGLELMTSRAHPHLSAMIPVDEAWALRRRPHRWVMPFGPMFADLKQRTAGKILRADQPSPPGVDWGPFLKPEDESELYVDLIVPDAGDKPGQDGG